MFFFTSLNQPGTSMRQQYTLLSPSSVLKMVKETSPLWISPWSSYFADLLESTLRPSVWTISSLHLELGHWPLPQHMLLLWDQDEYLQGKVTDWPKNAVTVSDAAGAVRKDENTRRCGKPKLSDVLPSLCADRCFQEGEENCSEYVSLA